MKAPLIVLQPFYYSFVEPNRFERIDAAQLNRDVFRWLQQRSGRPFFLFVNYFDAHSPYLPPPPYDGLFGCASDDLLRKAEPVLENGTPVDWLSMREREGGLPSQSIDLGLKSELHATDLLHRVGVSGHISLRGLLPLRLARKFPTGKSCTALPYH